MLKVFAVKRSDLDEVGGILTEKMSYNARRNIIRSLSLVDYFGRLE